MAAPTDLQRSFTPPARAGGALGHLGTLRQTLPVSLERLFENALDWEHLPWVHASNFTSIEKLDAGDWGWRARTGLPGGDGTSELTFELRLEREHQRWVTTTLDGPQAGSEIWTHVVPLAERSTLVLVDFFGPSIPADEVEEYGEYMQTLYRRLYDEDLRLMQDRQDAVDEHGARQPTTPGRVALGAEQEIRDKLPYVFEQSGRRWRLIDLEGTLVAHASRCPHQRGSLLEAEIEGGELICPWHGYRFDIRGRNCVSGSAGRLEAAPLISIEDGHIVAEFG